MSVTPMILLQPAMSHRTLTYSLLVFLAGSSYGFIVPAIKSAATIGVYPNSFVPIQYLVAFLVCMGAMVLTRSAWSSPRELLKLALLGVFTGGTSVCYYSAVSLLPSSAALTLLFQYIWVSVLIECIHEKRRPSTSTIVAIIIVLIGTLFATGLLDGSVGYLNPLGVLFGFGSAVFYALFLYYSGTLGTGHSMLLRTTMLTAGGLVFTSITSPGAYTTSIFDPITWPFAIGFAVLGILLPTGLINFASPKLTTGMVSIMASSELPVGILAAWAIVGDAPSPLVLFGALLVLVGIIAKQVPTLIQAARND